VDKVVAKRPDIMTLDVLKDHSDDYNVSVRVVTVQAKDTVPAPLRVLVSFGQHAREIVTSEVGLELLRVLAGDQAVPKVRPESRLRWALIVYLCGLRFSWGLFHI
jgi:hypothetical protein